MSYSKTTICNRFLPLLLAGSAAILVFVTSAYAQDDAAKLKGADGKALAEFLVAKGYHAIPLNKLRTGHISTEISVNGVSGIFIVDTGAGATVVEAKRKEKFGMISVKSSEKAVGAGGGGMELQKSASNQLILADYKIENFSVRLMNLDHVNSALKSLQLPEVDGVIGADVLTNGKAIMDYINLVLYLKQ